ncbi:hypothetical protein B0A48_12970 [Cryoendolithus antarcticus]|uniref:Uncharacterized protein n=1 Tax=Cryoendolithus antarcticus TaxID=1507870 RepID=A0A1V8SQH0_9PEZI|nr:hypothetical protein B0A48_12970 [Cryoendolithus antarcticus]
MGLFSILPESLVTIETWIIRAFLLLALLIGGPWLLVMLYDLLLYSWRAATYEFPYIGGRARGRQRPRAPSLKERPNGIKRRFSLATKPKSVDLGHVGATTSAQVKRRSTGSMGRGAWDGVDDRNIQVQLANATITTLTPYAELHPKLTPQGRYPVYLRMPVIVGDLLTVDELRLERILLEYNVPVVGSKKAQICALLDYLGAGRLASAWRRPMTLGVGRR